MIFLSSFIFKLLIAKKDIILSLISRYIVNIGSVNVFSNTTSKCAGAKIKVFRYSKVLFGGETVCLNQAS